MLNYKSVRNSEPQVRSNPALRQLNESSGFQKRLSTLLEPITLPFPTFQLVKESSAPILEQHVFYSWVRPSHLRSQWLILADDFPLLLADQKDTNRIYSLRIPFNKKQVQQLGPIICEASWDAQDHILWIWDVVYWEHQLLWETTPYSKRWSFVKKILETVLDCGHPMSDAEVRIPMWQSLQQLATNSEFDPAMSIEFQPEKAGQRRFLYLVRDEGIKFKPTSHHERKMVANMSIDKNTSFSSRKKKDTFFTKQECAIITEEEPFETPQPQTESKTESKPEEISIEPSLQQSSNFKHSPVKSKHTVARLMKHATSKIPGTYTLESLTDESLGLASIRSLEMSKNIREVLKSNVSILVDIQWYEPFQKYEVVRVKM